jgi:hypothetical protein
MRDDDVKCYGVWVLGCSNHYDHGVPKIDPTCPVLPYLQVAEIICSQIRSGKLPTGSRITEAEIPETARRTLAVLRDEGLIYTVPSAGATSADIAQAVGDATQAASDIPTM